MALHKKGYLVRKTLTCPVQGVTHFMKRENQQFPCKLVRYKLKCFNMFSYLHTVKAERKDERNNKNVITRLLTTAAKLTFFYLGQKGYRFCN